METAISCAKYSQVAGLIHATDNSSLCSSRIDTSNRTLHMLSIHSLWIRLHVEALEVPNELMAMHELDIP